MSRTLWGEFFSARRFGYPATNSDNSPCSSRTKLFYIEFSDLHDLQEDSIKPCFDQRECQRFEAEYFADEESVLVPPNDAAIVALSQQETL